ncbi:hypothetical protein T484DRAFT_1753538 [Baffinella frigidus]|nr:hypothetical protein T484DRAFT_1753538 [Cryptophyta sp. CCMP2293]
MCGQVILGTDKKKLAADEELDEDGYPIEAKDARADPQGATPRNRNTEPETLRTRNRNPKSEPDTRNTEPETFGFPLVPTPKYRRLRCDPKSEPGTRNPEPGTRYTEPGTRNPVHGTRNPEPETFGPPPPWYLIVWMRALTLRVQTPELGTRNRNPEHGTRNTEHGTRNTESTRNPEPGTRNVRIPPWNLVVMMRAPALRVR